ncbi:MAG: pyridoxamine 5'-phosphate oxidase family protein [Deltaproteobacteria bacterium]|nr:pyridoxamine 5'-phosphate oxidase family protein [Deltaproteobacteria bacterium]
MRRKHCEITDPLDIERILSSTTVGRLATNGGDGYPYITPVNFVYHEGKEIVISLAIWKPLKQWALIRQISKETRKV